MPLVLTFSHVPIDFTVYASFRNSEPTEQNYDFKFVGQRRFEIKEPEMKEQVKVKCADKFKQRFMNKKGVQEFKN